MHTVQIIEATNAGVGRHVLDLCEEFTREGDEVTLVYSTRRLDKNIRSRIEKLDGDRNVNLVVCDMRRGPHFQDYRVIRMLKKRFRNHTNVDLLHGHSTKGGAIARMIGQSLRCPVIYTPNAIRSMDPQLSALSRKIVTSIERWLSRYTHRIIAVSPEEEQHLIRDVQVPQNMVSVVPNGITSIALPDRSEARAKLQLEQQALILGFVGRLCWQKGPDLLIEALPKILEKLPQLKLAVIGDGDMSSKLRERAEELGVAKSIIWLGYQNGPHAMPAFDALVLPSRYEGLPYVLVEALSAGIPIVASDQTGCALLVENGVNGFVYPFLDSAKMADSVRATLENPETNRKLGEQSRLRSSRFTAEIMARQTREIYVQVLQEQRPQK